MDSEAQDANAATAATRAGQGICAELGALPPGALVTEKALAEMLGRTVGTIRRAVARGELPPSIRMLGSRRWTAGTIVRHVEERLERAALEAERQRRRFEGDLP